MRGRVGALPEGMSSHAGPDVLIAFVACTGSVVIVALVVDECVSDDATLTTDDTHGQVGPAIVLDERIA